MQAEQSKNVPECSDGCGVCRQARSVILPLNVGRVDSSAMAEFVDDSSPDWRMEKISYAAAYGDERILAYLFLPKNAKPPYQVMIGFSGGNIFYERSSAKTTDFDRFNFIMRSGRAFLYPIYKSTFERGDAIQDDTPNMSLLVSASHLLVRTIAIS
jgi:hypothetical protein